MKNSSKIFSHYSKHKEFIYLLTICIITFLLFSNILDNYIMVSDGIWLKDGVSFKISKFLEPNSHGWLRPIILLYFFVTYKIFGTNFFFYYLMNILFHFINSILIYIIIKNLVNGFTHSKEIAFLGALIFAVLFSHYEAIIVMCNICDILVATFCLLSFYFSLKYIQTDNKIFYISSIILFCIALLSKESAISYPFAFLSFLMIFLNKDFKKNIKILSPYFFILGIYLIYYSLHIFPAQNKLTSRTLIRNTQDIITINIDSMLELFLSSFSIIRYVYYYVYSLSFPYLSFIFEINRFIMFSSLILIIIGFFYKRNKIFKFPFKFAIFSIFWIILIFFPSTFSQEATLKSFILMPRIKYFYLPSFGFCFLLSILIFYIYQNIFNIFKKMIYIFVISFIISNSISTYIITQGYEQLTLNYRNMVTTAGRTLKGDFYHFILYLVNFPDAYKNFYGEGLKSAIDVIYKVDVQIIWIKEKDLKNLKNRIDLQKSFFVEFKDKILYNRTDHYRNILGKTL